MDLTLQRLMKWRFDLTRKNSNYEITNEEVDFEDYDFDTDIDRQKLVKDSKYLPPLFYKEHALSHLVDDLRNIGPLCLTKTDSFEQKHQPLKGPLINITNIKNKMCFHITYPRKVFSTLQRKVLFGDN